MAFNFGEFLRNTFGFGRAASLGPVAEAEPASTGVSQTAMNSRMLMDLQLAEQIYMNMPPWLNEEQPAYVPSGMGPLVASEVSCIITIEAQIKVNNDAAVDDIIHRYIMPNLRAEVEKGWALGGVLIKPYYSNATFNFTVLTDDEGNQVDTNQLVSVEGGNIKVSYLYPSQFLIDDWDHSGNILAIRIFSVVAQDGKYYTKVEAQVYDEVERILTITNTVYETQTAPIRYRWDNLGNHQVPLTTVPKWAKIPPRMVFADVHGCLVGLYKPAIANNGDITSPYGRAPLVRAADILRRIDIIFNAMDWEMESSLARLFIDERAIARDDMIPKKVAKYLVRILGDGGADKKFFEKFSPQIRVGEYTKILNFLFMQLEDIVGLAHGTVSEASEVSRTATEISSRRQRTYATVVDNQKSIEYAVRQVAKSIRVLQKPTEVAPELDMTFDFDDSIVSNPEQQLGLYMLLQNAGNIPAWKTNQMYFNMDQKEAIELWRMGQAEESGAAEYDDNGNLIEKVKNKVLTNDSGSDIIE